MIQKNKNKLVEEGLKIPTHVGFIMDGNGRWAKKRGLPRSVGHKYGADAMKKVVRACDFFGIRVLSLFAFSTENWNRPKNEVDEIMRLVTEFISDKHLQELIENNVQVRHLGTLDKVPEKVQVAIQNALKKTKHLTGMTLCICFNYGGRDEITHAVNQLLASGKKQVSPQDISNHLFTAGLPDLDLVVRTSGEQRISNFMLWQMAYAEFLFIEKHWPDMNKRTVEDIVRAYNNRERRFGAIQQTKE